MKLSRLISPLVLALACSALGPLALAQKLDSKYRAFPNIGVEFKSLKGLSDVPINTGAGNDGLIGKFKVEQSEFVKTDEGKRIPMKDIGCSVIYVEATGPTTGGKKEVTQEKDGRVTAKDFLDSVSGQPWGKRELVPEESVVKLAKDVEAQLSVFATELDVTYDASYTIEYVYEVYIIPLNADKLVFVWEYPGDKKLRRKWESAVKKSMKSFRFSRGGADTTDIDDVNSESSYEDLLEYHQNEVAQTPGWRLIETPSKQYLIKTNSDDDKDIDEVIKRLEASRELYEKDFPPPQAITSVSVVRVCGSEEVFHSYGDTSAGVGGWFNPRSEELVLYFGEDGKASTLSVMAHEGFHQYCHFLFDRAAAHRWFDEGHGDYYGAWKMKGKKLIQEEDMKGGYARIPELKEIIRTGDIKPLSEHIRYTHRQWQSQGPSGVSCYAQSFGLISFLRMGALGKVKSRYWDKSYATIIPNYMEALHKGFQDAYAKIREQGEKVLEQQDKLPIDDQDPDQIDRAEKRIESPWDYVTDADEIREAAMVASWGKIDEKKFEEDWLAWVDKQF